MILKDLICSEQQHCLSCPLIKFRSGKFCEELSKYEIEDIMRREREKEKMYDVYKR